MVPYKIETVNQLHVSTQTNWFYSSSNVCVCL